MTLPLTSSSPQTSSSTPSQSNWLAEHTQPAHRNTSYAGQKRRNDDVDDLEERSNAISSNLKRLRINNSILPHRSGSGTSPDSHASITSHPAYQPPSVQPVDDSLYHTPILQPRPHHYIEPQLRSHHGIQSLQTHLHPIHAHLSPNRDFTHTPPPLPNLHSPSRTSTQTTLSDEPMTLDIDPPVIDDSHRVIINDLSAELAEIEASERAVREKEQEQAFFLPDDIEKEIFGVPSQVLKNSPPADPPSAHTGSRALVLYQVPSSISVPEENDAVRKAVVEARRRMRERQKDPPPPSPFTASNITIHDADHDGEAEPYIANGLIHTSPTAPPRRSDRETTPFPFPDLHFRQRTMCAPYVPVDFDDAVPALSHVDHNVYNQPQQDHNDGNDCNWDDDVMEIE
jgi:hypothetical protein